jgi:hypothetical protein
MLIGAFGKYWSRDLVEWDAHGWRLLGRQHLQRGKLAVADFRKARGVYVLYSDAGIYYVGLASASGGLGSRLKDHLADRHKNAWTRFSWFSFDSVSETETYDDGVIKHEPWETVEGSHTDFIGDMEALLLAVTSPPGNVQRMKFRAGDEWLQVADVAPEVKTFADLKDRLLP